MPEPPEEVSTVAVLELGGVKPNDSSYFVDIVVDTVVLSPFLLVLVDVVEQGLHGDGRDPVNVQPDVVVALHQCQTDPEPGIEGESPVRVGLLVQLVQDLVQDGAGRAQDQLVSLRKKVSG